nr:unnamed protein product [Digitaria exilis]
MASTAAKKTVPEVALRSGSARPMPVVGMGTASFPLVHEATKGAVLAAIEVGFRHFDTAYMNLKMDYVDLYLIHWPVAIKPGPPKLPYKKEDAVPFDLEGVWRAMEECHRLGLAKAIGVSNFTTRHLDRVLAVATVPPAVNQVELNPVWQQRTLRAYCADKGIHVAAYSSLGGQNWDGTGNAVLESEVLAGIAKARGKSVAQGVTSIVKTYKKDRLKQNLEIFDWELTEEDRLKISQIPQKKVVKASGLFSQEGEFTSAIDPADLNIVEEYIGYC